MSTEYVNLGIDHGTSNSSIAVMEPDGPRVVLVRGEEVLPSVIYYNKRGKLDVGYPARKLMIAGKPGEGNGNSRYKLAIGQDERFDFPAARKNLSAQELGGLVIGELLKAYYEETNIQARSCVITIPAQFESNAQKGTQEAGMKAGLEHCPLLQEPVAAALAYHFNTSNENSKFMVFDLGGGTLDVSLLDSRDGELTVPPEGHTGDTLLGGSKFDKLLMDYILRERYPKNEFTQFSSGDPARSQDYGRLLLSVEEAKIKLSSYATAEISFNDTIADDRGNPVHINTQISVDEYNRLITAEVERAIILCQSLLGKNRLAARDISRLILIGGPTKTPYIKKLLHERLGIALEDKVDPMTAVARGAAIFASTLKIPETTAVPVAGVASIPAIGITMKYPRTTQEPRVEVFGQVTAGGRDLSQLTVEIRRADGKWGSGRVPVDADGAFERPVLLASSDGKPTENTFTTRLLDAAGRELAVVLDPKIWYPMSGGEGLVRLPNALGVAVKGNKFSPIVEAGSNLPFQSNPNDGQFTAATRLRANTDDELSIAVLEVCPNPLEVPPPFADCCKHIGRVVLGGTENPVAVDVPLGTPIEITFDIKETLDTVVGVTAFVNDQQISLKATLKRESFIYKLDDVEYRFQDMKRGLADIEALNLRRPIPEVSGGLAILNRMELLYSIQGDLARAKNNDRAASDSAYKRTLELACVVTHLRKLQVAERLDHAYWREFAKSSRRNWPANWPSARRASRESRPFRIRGNARRNWKSSNSSSRSSTTMSA